MGEPERDPLQGPLGVVLALLFGAWGLIEAGLEKLGWKGG